jgi:hypothetical protein
MEPYILTEADIAALSEQGFDMRGVSAGAEATAREAETLRGTPAAPAAPADPAAPASPIIPTSSATPAPVTFAEADGTTSAAPSASAIPQSLPAAAVPGTTMVPTGSNTPLPDQPSGLSGILSGLTGMFGGQGNTAGSFNPAANAGIAQSTDPFEGLSRNQRMMLGFAALRDAAASLNGQNTSFFNDQLGVFESARDRERLRVQGLAQARGEAMMSLMPVYQEISRLQSLELPIPQYLLDIVNATLSPLGFNGQGGMPTMPTTTPTAPTTTPTAPTTPATTPATTPTTPATQPTEAAPAPAPTEEQPLSPTRARMAEIEARRAAIQDQMRRREAGRAGTADLEAELNTLDDEYSRLVEQDAAETAAAEAETAAATEAANLTMPTIQTALDYLIEDFDEDTGEPILRRELMYRVGRAALDAAQPPEYMQYLGAIRTLKSSILIEGLQQATFGALSAAEQSAVEALQGSLDPADPIGSYDTLIRLRNLTQQIIDRHSGNQGGGSEAPASSGSGRINWNG